MTSASACGGSVSTRSMTPWSITKGGDLRSPPPPTGGGGLLFRMRVFMLTLGTQGDFELFRILGRELRGRGHRVVLGTSECYAARTREAGLEWERVGAGTWEELHAVLQSLAPVADRKM